MSRKADGGNVRPKRAPGRRWTTRRRPPILTDPILGAWEGATLAAIEKLPPRELVALTLASTGLKQHEIAAQLGLSVDAVNMRLWRARRRVRDELGRADGAGALAFLGVLPGHLRALRGRLMRLAGEVVSHQGAALAIAPLWACGLSLGAASGARPEPPTQLVATAVAPSEPAASTHTLVEPPVLRQATGPLVVPGRGSSSERPPDRSSLGLLPLTADSPDTADVLSVAPSPHYDDDHTIVALGLGHICACPILLRSTDGGATWQSTAIAASGDQVVLPPNFPADPRIFIGSPPSAASVDWVSAGWGQPFVPLALPPAASGQLAIVGNQVLSVGTTALWRLGPGGAAVPVVAYQGSAFLTATPDAAYILTPPHAIGAGVAAANTPDLFVCTPDCRLSGTVPLPSVGPLAVTGSTVIAASGQYVVLSKDSGHTFASIAGPAGDAAVDAVSAAGSAVWLVTNSQIEARSASDGGWKTVNLGTAVRGVMALSSTRLLARLPDVGLRCSADGGANWETRCPPYPAP